jgi:hypothetical protein
METRKRMLGVEHPDTLISMANLAFTWKSLERDYDVSELIKECFLIQKQKLGANHSHTVSFLRALNE